jgi:hypothetical protein
MHKLCKTPANQCTLTLLPFDLILGRTSLERAKDDDRGYQVLEPNSEVILEPGYPGLLLPDQPHLVEPLGSIANAGSNSTIGCLICSASPRNAARR